MHKALIPNDLISNNYTIDLIPNTHRPNTWYTIHNIQHKKYLMPKTHCTTVTIPSM